MPRLILLLCTRYVLPRPAQHIAQAVWPDCVLEGNILQRERKGNRMFLARYFSLKRSNQENIRNRNARFTLLRTCLRVSVPHRPRTREVVHIHRNSNASRESFPSHPAVDFGGLPAFLWDRKYRYIPMAIPSNSRRSRLSGGR